MDARDMNSTQQVLHRILIEDALIPPKAIAFRLHKHVDYLSDICRRERVDFFAVANEILKEVKPLAESDPHRYLSVVTPIANLLFAGTGLNYYYIDPKLIAGVNFKSLCELTGTLCQAMGSAIQSLARIEADGKYDENDDVEIASCLHKLGLLSQRLSILTVALQQRRASKCHL